MKTIAKLGLAVLLFMAIAVSNHAQAQTKEETEQWINEKMNLHINKVNMQYFYGGDLILKEFSLKDGYLSAKFTIPSFYNKWNEYKNERNIIYQNMPIKYFKYAKETTLQYHGHQTILDIYFDSYIEYEKGADYRFVMGILDLEPNLLERTIKAFNHYKTFYPTPEKPKQAF